MNKSIAVAVVAILALMAMNVIADNLPTTNSKENTLQLGAFSISLTVKDITVSKDFYSKLGFEEVGGNMEQNWLVLRNGSTTIGLFQGMFDQNLMTFNPGWSATAEPLDAFEDIRDVQQTLKERGVELATEADPAESGPASFMLVDPDGNQILVDQHVPKAP